MHARRFVREITMAAFALGSLSTAAAPPQEYPSRPIHLIVPAASGGAADLVARQVGERLRRALRTTVVVESKPGASGVIGSELVAHGVPDGFTRPFATSATQVINAYAIGRLPYDPLRDFTPIIDLGHLTSVVVVSPALPVHTIVELSAYARARPGMLNDASSGTGSANHIDTEVFAALAGILLVHIPYRGTAGGYRALLRNEVQLMLGSITSALPDIRAGTLRARGVRRPTLPAASRRSDDRPGRAGSRRRSQVVRGAGAGRRSAGARPAPRWHAGRYHSRAGDARVACAPGHVTRKD
jgi:tripartite-type tricarboxylate transporter receptor subunit TctC